MVKIRSFCHWDIAILVIVSYFVLRISIFLTEKTEFSIKHYLRLPVPPSHETFCM